MNDTKASKSERRFNLQTMLVGVAGFGVLCLFFAVVGPELFMLAVETEPARNFLVATLALTGVFTLILVLGFAIRGCAVLLTSFRPARSESGKTSSTRQSATREAVTGAMEAENQMVEEDVRDSEPDKRID